MLTETDTTILQESLPFWDQLNGNQKELLKSGSSLMKYAKNSNVHSDNSQCVGMLLVKSGSLRVYMLSEEGAGDYPVPYLQRRSMRLIRLLRLKVHHV